MKILMVASEANPFSKTGGLGDVVYSLSKALVKEKNEVTIIIPLYQTTKTKNAKEEIKELFESTIRMNWRCNNALYFETILDGIRYVFVENEFYFGRDGMYGYEDDAERFAFFSLSVLDLIDKEGFDIVHCHDWQAGMVPLLLNEKFRKKKPKTIMTIHNPAFVGYFSKDQLFDFYNLNSSLYTSGLVRFNNACSSLKAGLVSCNYITTVSPTHRNELLTSEGANGLEQVLIERQGTFTGIINGIDVDEFNPKKDKIIAKKFDKTNIEEGKKANKKALLDSFYLPQTDGPVFGIVTRLTWQKGTDVLFNNAEMILNRGGVIVALGSGEKGQEDLLENLRARFPEKVGIYIGYSNEVAHRIYSGSDFFLMPSLFEPCGISQLISHQYATLPIVRETGGLCDTVYGYTGENADKSDGIRFSVLDRGGLKYAIDKAFEVYENKDILKKMRINAISLDHSWKESAKKYLTIYKLLLKEEN